MDLEEQRLKKSIEIHEEALKEKVNMLKERFERLKRMTDVKSKVEERPGLMFMGSILTGFITKKWANGKTRHLYRANPGKNLSSMSTSSTGGVWEPVIAIISAIATRAVVGILSEFARKLMPRRHERFRSDQNFSNS